MKSLNNVSLENVKEVYNGPEGDLWELIMGEQIHVGGFASSLKLATKAELSDGLSGVDLCCCNGAGMRFLLKFKNALNMTGVDATKTVVDRGIQRCQEDGWAEKTSFVLTDVTDNGLPADNYDFVWGEDAWCYVENKSKLITEAARIVKPGGTIAFTDWIEADNLGDEEAERFMTFMKFPNILNISDYSDLLQENACEVKIAENTGVYAEHVDLYLDMLNKQLTYDALKLIGFDMATMEAMGKEMAFMQKLAHENKIAQGLFVAVKH